MKEEQFVTVGMTFGTRVAGASAFGLSKGENLIVKGLKKMAEAEKKEKEKSKNEAEILNAYFDSDSRVRSAAFRLNQPASLAVNGISERHFIGEEEFLYRKSESYYNFTLVDLFVINSSRGSVTSDYITVKVDKAKQILDGFTHFYNNAFDHANEKMIIETRKEAKEKEEKAHKEALKPVIDDPLFGSW